MALVLSGLVMPNIGGSSCGWKMEWKTVRHDGVSPCPQGAATPVGRRLVAHYATTAASGPAHGRLEDRRLWRDRCERRHRGDEVFRRRDHRQLGDAVRGHP